MVNKNFLDTTNFGEHQKNEHCPRVLPSWLRAWHYA